jgi:hypothetical protein
MIDLAAVNPDKDSALCGLGRGLGKLVSFLNPRIVSWAKTKFPEIPIYICSSRPLLVPRDKQRQLLTMRRWFPQIIDDSEMRSPWSSPKPLFAGIGAAFGPIGAGNPADVEAAPGSTARSATSSDG